MKRGKSRWKIALLAAALAFAPVVGLNLLLWLHISANGGADIEEASASMLRLAERNLDDAMTQIVAFSMNVEHASCSEDTMKALGTVILKAPHVAEISVIDPAGVPVCSPSGRPRVVRAASGVHDTQNPNLKFAVVDFGSERGQKIVQLLWQYPDGWNVSALIPGERLLPALVVGRLQADFVSRLSLADGTLIAGKLSRSDMSVEGASAFEERTISNRYPLGITVSVPSAALWDNYSQLFLLGNAGGVALAFLSIVGALAVSRQMEGPVRDIENSIRRGDFIPYYQPIMCIRTGRLLGCEVLVRRRRGDQIEGPATFIPLVEATGQIFEITRLLMASARDELGPIYAVRPHLKVSFNLVAGHFTDARIVEDVEEIFTGAQLKLSQVVLEVTERHPLPNLSAARVIIARLQELGVRIALDDVGTGHGGLSYLLKLGVDQMKMDKMFVDAIGTDRYSTAIIDTLVKLAADLNIEFVAEGVETFEQIAYLKERGVDAAQGYVFSPPLPGPLFLELIRTIDPVSSRVPERVKKAIRGAAADVEAA